MNTYRNGKIARLPKTIREELNHLLADNTKPGPDILDWLNTHPDVQKILAQCFEGYPISQQNLSQWRRGGYREWVKLQENHEFARELVEHSDTMEADFHPEKITVALATVAAIDFARDAKARHAECKTAKQRWECSCELQNQLSRRRRDACRLGHLKLRQEYRDHEVTAEKKAAEAAADMDRRRQMLAYFKLQPNLAEEARQRGNTDWHRDVAALVLELEHKLKIGILGRKSKEFVTDEFEEFDEIATRNEVAQGLTSEFTPVPSEGRVPQVPNIQPIPSSTPPSSIALAKEEVPLSNSAEAPLPPDAVALANDCTPEEFAGRATTPKNAKNHPTNYLSINSPHSRTHQN